MIYVTADIHGNRRRFDSVMEQIRLTSEDTLYVLGDVIDRHADGVRILQQLITRGVPVCDFHRAPMNLEKVFMEVTEDA